jgi:hypothetical protein
MAGAAERAAAPATQKTDLSILTNKTLGQITYLDRVAACGHVTVWNAVHSLGASFWASPQQKLAPSSFYF